jgi:hypothetical protein
MSRPGWSFTDDIQNAPIAHALHPGLELPPSLFESFMLPEFSLRRARFNAAMAGHSDVDLFRGMSCPLVLADGHAEGLRRVPLGRTPTRKPGC